MARLSYQQVQTILRSVGFAESQLILMAAIAMGESGLKTDAINPGRTSHEYSVGLLQINTLVHKNYSVSQLLDPYTNAREALRIYRAQGLRAWGAYTNGSYRTHMAASQRAYSGGSASAPPVLSTTLPVSSPGFLSSAGFESDGAMVAGSIGLGLVALALVFGLSR